MNVTIQLSRFSKRCNGGVEKIKPIAYDSAGEWTASLTNRYVALAPKWLGNLDSFLKKHVARIDLRGDLI